MTPMVGSILQSLALFGTSAAAAFRITWLEHRVLPLLSDIVSPNALDMQDWDRCRGSEVKIFKASSALLNCRMRLSAHWA